MDIKSLMRQAQEMQKKMQQAQEDLAETKFEGSSGGGMIKITISGDMNAKKIEIDESLLNKAEKDILEDLIIVAFNEAKKKAEEDSANSMKSITNGVSLPSGFKL